MSDGRIRELEQRWQATGDLEHERLYVRARLRARSLPRPRLLLAAYAGSTAALEVLGDKGFPEEPNLLTWVRGLGKGRLSLHPELSREAAGRAMLAALTCLQRHTALGQILQHRSVCPGRLPCRTELFGQIVE